MRGLRLAAGLIALALVPEIAFAQSDRDLERARNEYHRAQTLYDQHRYDQALALFRSSLATLPSPNTRLYIARCLRESGHRAEAFREFDVAAREADERIASDPRYRDSETSAVAERDALRSQIAFVTVHFDDDPPADTIVEVHGAVMPRAEWDVPQPADPGDVTVRAHASGRAPFTETEHLAAGGRVVVTVAVPVVTAEASSAPPPAATGSTEPWLATGVAVAALGAAALGTALVFGKLDADEYNYLQAVCSAGCASDRSGNIALGQTYQTTANVLFVTSGVLLLGGAVLLGLAARHASAHTPSVAVAPVNGGLLTAATIRF